MATAPLQLWLVDGIGQSFAPPVAISRAMRRALPWRVAVQQAGAISPRRFVVGLLCGQEAQSQSKATQYEEAKLPIPADSLHLLRGSFVALVAPQWQC